MLNGNSPNTDIAGYVNSLLNATSEKDERGELRAFFLVWKDGSTENLYGLGIADAFVRKGYKKTLISFIDYYKEI